MSSPALPAAEPSAPVLAFLPGARTGGGLLAVVVCLVAVLTAVLRLLVG